MNDKDVLALERRKREALQKVFQDQNTLALRQAHLSRAIVCLATGQITESEFDENLIACGEAVKQLAEDAAIARGALLETEEGDAGKRV
jgi:hypothetical protein